MVFPTAESSDTGRLRGSLQLGGTTTIMLSAVHFVNETKIDTM